MEMKKDCTTCAHCGLEEDKGYCQVCVIEKRPGAIPSEWKPDEDAAASANIKYIPGLDERGEMSIKDSGNRQQFYDADGNPMAVRDIQTGKGRCDLLPLGMLGRHFKNQIFEDIETFMQSGDGFYLHDILNDAPKSLGFKNAWDMVLETAIHFEQGAEKYSPNNWKKGIPLSRYIDSAVRHYIKFLRGDRDERHDRAFVWNIMCAIWTCENMPELNEYKKAAEEREGAKNG